MRTTVLSMVVLAGGCGGGGTKTTEARPPTVSAAPGAADPDYPTAYTEWSKSPESVRDDVAGEVRWHYASADGSVLVKEHRDLADEAAVTRLDIRRRTSGGPYDGWTYLSFDPATRKQIPTDAETCHLCHATAPADGTFVRFPRLAR